MIRSDFHITKEDECKVIRNLANDILTRFEALKTDVWAVKQSTDEDRSKLQQEEGQMKMVYAFVQMWKKQRNTRITHLPLSFENGIFLS